jgi:hypothetical protein
MTTTDVFLPELVSEAIGIREIQVKAVRNRNEKLITDMMESIRQCGLLHPIILWRPTSLKAKWILVDGFTRLEAWRGLGFDLIEARTFTGNPPWIGDWIKRVQTVGQICRDRAA